MRIYFTYLRDANIRKKLFSSTVDFFEAYNKDVHTVLFAGIYIAAHTYTFRCITHSEHFKMMTYSSLVFICFNQYKNCTIFFIDVNRNRHILASINFIYYFSINYIKRQFIYTHCRNY